MKDDLLHTRVTSANIIDQMLEQNTNIKHAKYILNKKYQQFQTLIVFVCICMYIYAFQIENTQNNTVGEPLYCTTKVTVLVSKLFVAIVTNVALSLVQMSQSLFCPQFPLMQ